VPVVYEAPLLATNPPLGDTSFGQTILYDCGAKTAHDSWFVISGSPTNVDLQEWSLFIQRDGQLLLYFQAA
jgi:hypothetical protein